MFRPSYGPAFTLIGAKISCLKLLFSGGKRQKGVYSSKLFYKDDQNDPMESVHVILLDARSGRDPTYATVCLRLWRGSFVAWLLNIFFWSIGRRDIILSREMLPQ